MFKNLKRQGAIILLILLFAAPVTDTKLVTTANAQTTQEATQPPPKRTTTTATYGGWIVNCVKTEKIAKEICTAKLQMINKEKRTPILAWVLGFNKDRVLMTELITPTDVFIGPGVNVILDEDTKKPVKLHYQACSVRGCQSSLPMTRKLRKRLAKAKKVSVSIAAINGKTFNFNLPFSGFDKALADLLK